MVGWRTEFRRSLVIVFVSGRCLRGGPGYIVEKDLCAEGPLCFGEAHTGVSSGYVSFEGMWLVLVVSTKVWSPRQIFRALVFDMTCGLVFLVKEGRKRHTDRQYRQNSLLTHKI